MRTSTIFHRWGSEWERGLRGKRGQGRGPGGEGGFSGGKGVRGGGGDSGRGIGAERRVVSGAGGLEEEGCSEKEPSLSPRLPRSVNGPESPSSSSHPATSQPAPGCGIRVSGTEAPPFPSGLQRASGHTHEAIYSVGARRAWAARRRAGGRGRGGCPLPSPATSG